MATGNSHARSLAFGSGLWLAFLFVSPGAGAEPPVDFERQVAPILLSRCLECHHADDPAGELSLADRQGLLRGGSSGAVIAPGKIDGSLLLERIESGEMPPPKQGKSRALPAEEIALLRRWISEGASWPADRRLDLFEKTLEHRGGRDWWSLQPVQHPPIPSPKQVERVANPIDAFIVSRLETEGLQLAPAADRAVFVRRLYHDLLGLPPAAEAVRSFVEDPRPDSYERLVDQLLARPQFGERWGRFWLDLVRYAETCGYERDQPKPNAWKYRDYVTNSLNADKPYDRFIIEQLAGDELPDRTEDTVVATGFLMLGTWNDEPNDPQEYKYERLEDLVHATSSAFLAFTVKCARCHEHKFDPIPQADYYRLAAAFWPGPIEPRERELLGGVSASELGFPVLGWTDIRRQPPPLHLLKKGDPHRPGPAVDPGFLSMIPGLDRPLTSVNSELPTTGRRLDLALRIAHSKNPLTARVQVNRLWLNHFGQALVRSPANFGFTGEKPTHPELLDWLADALIQKEWRMKELHRLMVLSSTYQQASLHPQQAAYEERDFANRLWWRAERRRLDAEALRDAMLVAGDQLDLRLGGASFKPSISPEALEGLSRKGSAWEASPLAEQRRRSVYSFVQRSLLPPLMTTFDFADTTLPCAQRDVTTVAPQALALLNNSFAHQCSEQLAARVRLAGGGDPVRQVSLAWQFALGRAPTKTESSAALRHLDAQRARFATMNAGRQEREKAADALPVRDGLVLHLSADQPVELDDQGRVVAWRDRSGAGHSARQESPAQRPQWIRQGVNERPVVRFNGQRQFLSLEGQLLTKPSLTIFAIANDRGPSGHRTLFSNWSGRDNNSVTSLFLGLTADATVRLSDDFPAAGVIASPARHFLITATANDHDATVRQNDQTLAQKGNPLAARRLDTPYVIGQQGNIDGEYWHGDVAEIVVYDRELSDAERSIVEAYLNGRYALWSVPPPPDPSMLALASLCHVLLNTNEFLYVD